MMPDCKAGQVCTPKAIGVEKKEAVQFPEISYEKKEFVNSLTLIILRLGLYYLLGSTFQSGERVTGVNNEVCVIQDKGVIVS